MFRYLYWKTNKTKILRKSFIFFLQCMQNLMPWLLSNLRLKFKSCRNPASCIFEPYLSNSWLLLPSTLVMITPELTVATSLTEVPWADWTALRFLPAAVQFWCMCHKMHLNTLQLDDGLWGPLNYILRFLLAMVRVVIELCSYLP